MDVVCRKCGAFHWLDEKLADSTQNNIISGSCCRQGKIKVALPQRPPPTLWRLFTGIHAASNNFFANIQNFNSALAFTSKGSDSVEERPGNSPYVYKIGGQVYHRSGNLEPPLADPAQPNAPAPAPCQYAQLWVYDPQSEAQLDAVVNEMMANRANEGCNRPLMRELTGVIQAHHVYA